MSKRKFAVKSIKLNSKVLKIMFSQLVYIPRVLIAAYIGLTFLLNITTPVSASGINNVSSSILAPEVFGGEKVELEQAAGTVAIVDADIPNGYYGHYCGGTLIAPNMVITAAHCTIFQNNPMIPSEIDVIAKTVELTSHDRERIGVEEIIRHPDYNSATGYADIAILKLRGNSTAETANYITLDRLELWQDMLDAGTLTTVFGWGETATRKRSNDLMAVSVPLVDQATCQEAYLDEGYVVTNGTLCAGYAAGGSDACSGDSGGPMMVPDPNNPSEWLQIGVVSWGDGCAQADSYGVYTSIISHISWLEEALGNEEALVGASGTEEGNTIVLGPILASGMSQAIFIPVIQ